MSIRSVFFKARMFCRALFSYPKKTLANLNETNYNLYWKEKRGANIGQLSSWQKERADFILSVVGKNEKEQVAIADVGCGDGSILTYLRKNLLCNTHCVGYDGSEFALECAHESGVQTHILDISKKESFVQLAQADYYLLLETLEHIPHSEELLLHTLSKSNKGVFFSFPNTGYIRHRLRLLFGKFPLQWRILPNEHVRFWTYTDLKWWLKALNITEYTIHCYKGVPILNKILPGLFAAGFVIYVPKNE